MAKNVREIDWERVRAELAGSIEAAKQENITLIHYNSTTGEAWRIRPDGEVTPYEMKNQTDWARVNALTEEEIEAADTFDDGLPDDWLDHAEILRLPGEKVAKRRETH